jgi:hypothetical protein
MPKYSHTEIAEAQACLDFYPANSPFWDTRRAQDVLAIVQDLKLSPEPVYCLIFGDEGTIALGTECKTPAECRVLLDDRIANGEAFPGERCGRVTRAAYRAANGGTMLRERSL